MISIDLAVTYSPDFHTEYTETGRCVTLEWGICGCQCYIKLFQENGDIKEIPFGQVKHIKPVVIDAGM